MQLSQRLRSLCAHVRLIISGTPIQNNLSEMWALFDFAVPGLLGPLRAFKLAFEKPIMAVRGEHRAGDGEYVHIFAWDGGSWGDRVFEGKGDRVLGGKGDRVFGGKRVWVLSWHSQLRTPP